MSRALSNLQVSFVKQPFGVKETKADEKKVPPEFKNVEGYPHSYWLAAEKAGYSREVQFDFLLTC